MCPLLKP
jgi:CRP-like cAMP-binding protein